MLIKSDGHGWLRRKFINVQWTVVNKGRLLFTLVFSAVVDDKIEIYVELVKLATWLYIHVQVCGFTHL